MPTAKGEYVNEKRNAGDRQATKPANGSLRPAKSAETHSGSRGEDEQNEGHREPLQLLAGAQVAHAIAHDQRGRDE
jgi:hypothetical protein